MKRSEDLGEQRQQLEKRNGQSWNWAVLAFVMVLVFGVCLYLDTWHHDTLAGFLRDFGPFWMTAALVGVTVIYARANWQMAGQNEETAKEARRANDLNATTFQEQQKREAKEREPHIFIANIRCDDTVRVGEGKVQLLARAVANLGPAAALLKRVVLLDFNARELADEYPLELISGGGLYKGEDIKRPDDYREVFRLSGNVDNLPKPGVERIAYLSTDAAWLSLWIRYGADRDDYWELLIPRATKHFEERKKLLLAFNGDDGAVLRKLVEGAALPPHPFRSPPTASGGPAE